MNIAHAFLGMDIGTHRYFSVYAGWFTDGSYITNGLTRRNPWPAGGGGGGRDRKRYDPTC